MTEKVRKSSQKSTKITKNRRKRFERMKNWLHKSQMTQIYLKINDIDLNGLKYLQKLTENPSQWQKMSEKVRKSSQKSRKIEEKDLKEWKIVEKESNDTNLPLNQRLWPKWTEKVR